MKTAIIGFGAGGVKVARCLEKQQRPAIAGVDPNRLLDIGIRSGFGMEYYEELEYLLDSPHRPDIAIVATPNNTHNLLARRCLEAGIGVLLMPPMAHAATHAASLVALAKQRGLGLQLLTQNRYSAAAQYLHRAVQQGWLGQLRELHYLGVWNRDARYYRPDRWQGSLEQDGGLLYSNFYHSLDMLTWLAGTTPSLLYAHLQPGLVEIEAGGQLVLDFDGVPATFAYSTQAWQRTHGSTLTVVGERGTVVLGGPYLQHLSYWHVAEQPAPTLPPAKDGPTANEANLDQALPHLLQQVGSGALPDAATLGLNGLIEQIYTQAMSRLTHT